ncbi:NAD-dependent epimerase/dehydratase family protein [Vibrio diazotrophicus]|uniref:NAD-dependent epimerase/dehydratase family protein n=1 Tax=Vibrio diazotrophicus TaxID=685 RepID=UPI0005A8D773|nr:NAD-dependent epimerase/dehydratase family protein [Vibrio diazotrophicus]
MKICIVGSSGLVGKALEHALSGIKDYKVYSLTRKDCDVTNLNIPELVNQLGSVDCIINCAAQLNSNDEEQLFSVNTIGALNVAKLAYSLGAKLVHISSLSCELSDENEYFNKYAISKLAGELLVKDFCEEIGLKYHIVRCSQIYDMEWKAYKSQPFLYNIIKQTKNNNTITLFGSRDVVRNYVSIDLVTQGIIAIICKDTNSVYKYILGETLRVSNLIDVVAKVRNKNIKIHWNEKEKSLKSIYVPVNVDNVISKWNVDIARDIKEIINNE